MQCSKCRNEEIVFQPYSGQHLCHDHFIADFEAKAKRAIRVNRWMQPGDHIGVVARGDPAGSALLFFFRKLTGNRKDIRVSGITVKGRLEEIMADAQTSGFTRIALATTLEDAAAVALTAILRGDAETCFLNAHSTDTGLPLITPFCHIPAEEVATYARINGLDGERDAPLPEDETLDSDVRAMMADYSHRHPAAPHAVLNLCESLAACGRHADKSETNDDPPLAGRTPNS
ncbi:MAG: hypothetical protein M0Q92_10765 [Methanoregula sp.]|jgi:hypothetical protein|nr:hypothetical protein [Methanoregula sp.]